MPVGDVFSGIASVVSGASVDIRPATGVEVVIHNVYHDGDVELHITDGTIVVNFDTDPSRGAYTKVAFHLTNGQWLRVKNVDTVTVNVAWDGIVTK
jgi:hypothetical protein